MTDERSAIEALARCRFLPGSWAKRFARSLNDMAEDAPLTHKQRVALWQNVYKFRRQMPKICLEEANWRRAAEPDRLAFEDTLELDPTNCDVRLVYSDWLEDRGEVAAVEAQRFMVTCALFPHLKACGAAYTSKGTMPCNFEWTLGMEAFQMFGILANDRDHLPYWHRSRRRAETALAKALTAQGKERAAR